MESQSHHSGPKKKLTLEKEEAVDPLFHLFTEIPLTSFERDPDFFSKNVKNNKKSRQPPSQYSSRALQNGSSVGSFRRLDYQHRRASLHEAEEQLSGTDYMEDNDRVKQHRIKNICRNVIKKLKRNNVYSRPIPEQEVALNSENRRRRFAMPRGLQIWWGVSASIIMLSLFVSESLFLVFPELGGSYSKTAITVLGIVLMMGELGLGFGSIKHENGREIEDLIVIVKNYSKKQLFLDATILIFLVLILTNSQPIFNQIFMAIFMIKLSALPDKLKPIQRIINRYSNVQNFWSIFKIILLNLCIAHAVAILLNLMAMANPDDNWQIAKGITDGWWFERYVWSYYWSVAIMTTVGFGGIAPASYGEATWIILIEIFCSLVFAYNLSCLGSFIVRRGKAEESLSVFEGYAEKKEVSKDLKKKIMNYLSEKDDLNVLFNVQKQNAVIKSLPHEFRKQVLEDSIKNSIHSLPFFSQLHLKAIYQFSQCIERSLYLPNQTVKAFDDPFNIYILEKGEVGFVCRSPHSRLHNLIVNTVQRREKEKHFLLSLDFITQERSKLEIRSTACSVILKLPFQAFKAHLSTSACSHQFYCFLRDRSKHNVDEFETIPCENCHSKHSKLSCPKLHFMPIRQLVIARHLRSAGQEGHNNCGENSSSRIMRRKMNSLNISKYCQVEYARLPAPALHRYEERKGTVFAIKQPSNNLLDAMKRRSFWKISQSSLGEADWASFLSLQLGGEERAEDEIWPLASDSIHDYCGYFPEGNLASIARKRSLASLVGRRK